MKNTMRKILSLVLIVMLMVPLNIVVDAIILDGSAEILFEGKGTKQEPYIIDSADDLVLLSDLTNDGNDFKGCYFFQTKDIKFIKRKNNIVPIGNKDVNFMGNYDGNYCKISGVNIDLGEQDYIGLFGCTSNGEIINLFISDSTFVGRYEVGALVGYNKSKVKRVFTESSVSVSGVSNVGGIIGLSNRGVTECINSANVKSTNEGVGGICGMSNDGVALTYVVNIGEITGNIKCGGIVGRANGNIYNSYNAGDIFGNSAVGGIVGMVDRWNGGGINRDKCYNIGNIFCEDEYYGSLDATYRTTGIPPYRATDCSDNTVIGALNGDMSVGYSVEYMKSQDFIESLGEDFISDKFNLNQGFPILKWQVELVSDNIYNMGEETYSFGNFVDKHAVEGHCFGMSVTSSGYYLGLLDTKDVGANNCREIYNLSKNDTVIEPICYYQDIQGSARDKSAVAGGTNYKDKDKFDIESDWNEVVNYVKNHKYDNKGTLQIGFIVDGSGGHALNFLRYEVVDGQERIYAYDNVCPHKEVYFYQSETGNVYRKYQSCGLNCYLFSTQKIDSIVLRDVTEYLNSVSSKETVKRIIRTSFYAVAGALMLPGATFFIMEMDSDNGEYYMYEFPEDTTTIKITPLVDNASFRYMGKEYSFGKIDEDTYAEFTLSTSEDDKPDFEIINAPSDTSDEPDVPDEPDEPDTPDTPTEPCTCKCHGNFIQRLFFKLINFFQKLFGMNKVCACGVKH